MEKILTRKIKNNQNQIRFSALFVLITFVVCLFLFGFVKTSQAQEITQATSNWNIFAGSDSLLSIPSGSLEKQVKMITATLEAQSYMLGYNEKTENYEAVIKAPAESGKYQLTIRTIFSDNTYRQSDQVVLVKPYGYLYANKFEAWSWKNPLQFFYRKKVLVEDAKVSLYTLNKAGDWVLWPASFFKQKNPQSTNEKGEYVFVAPPGEYFLVASAEGLVEYQSGEFQILEESVINSPIKLRALFPWRALLVSVIIFGFVLFAGKKTLFQRKFK